ncbi:mannosyltransferase family protein [Dictyobacter formicarum]|uniref:mannosyltransferase family protein n=1 Tax=Dictyobacter formicarum TaxID=2778368 RepID=UPI0019167B29|nr:glycosyltransferase family 39 protein [Dictyobacter formicarum]
MFVVNRFVILVLTFLGLSLFPGNQTLTPLNCFIQRRACIKSWMHYDVLSYIAIADKGYVASTARQTAFFPLYPTLLRLPGHLLGGSIGDYYIAGLLISNLCFFFALIVLQLLISDLFDESTARKSLFYVAFAPYALFYFAGYTESLFLFLCLMTFFFLSRAQKDNSVLSWWLAGLSGLLTALSRSQGLLLMLPFFVVYVQHFFFTYRFAETSWRQKILAFCPLALIPLGLGIYMFYLWKAFHDPFLFSSAQHLYWGRLPLTSPLTTFRYVIKACFIPSPLQILNILNLISVLIPLGTLLIGWRRIPLHYNLFALVLIIFATLYPLGTDNALTSVPRFMTVVFPVTIIFASIKWPRFDHAYLALTLPIFALNVFLFVNHYWVA